MTTSRRFGGTGLGLSSSTSELHLTSLEQSLLYLLAANAGRVVTREEILDPLWGTDYVAESNVGRPSDPRPVHALLDDWREPRIIATVPRQGFGFLLAFTCSNGRAQAF